VAAQRECPEEKKERTNAEQENCERHRFARHACEHATPPR